MLERPTESEVGSLLLQVRSPSYRARHAKWMGWTVNVAHPSAIPVVLLLVSCVAVPITVERAMGVESSVVLLTLAVGIAVMCLLCVYLSSTTRYRAKTPMDS